MPQLDSVTFFTQFFWTILSVFVFHFCVSKWIVPAFSRAQKSRSKVATLNSKSSSSDKSIFTPSSDSNREDYSSKESTLTLLRQVLSLSFHTLLLGKDVETKFYKNRVQDMYANPSVLGAQSAPLRLNSTTKKQSRRFTKIATLAEKQSKYVDSLLRTDLPKTVSQNKHDECAIQMDDNLSSRRTQLFSTLRNIRQKVAHKSKTEWIPHGILNMGRAYLQSPRKKEKREEASNLLVFRSNGKGCTSLRFKKIETISPSHSLSDDINKNVNKGNKSKNKTKSKKIQTPKNKK